MKKKIISLLILSLSIGIVGCGNKTRAKRTKEEIPQQFEVLSTECIERSTFSYLIIIKHKETGKRFIAYRGDRMGGICPLD